MSINTHYVLFTPLEQLFVDNMSGDLLSSGYLLFFIDTARTVEKPVYMITGSPPNYSYIPYGAFDPISGGWKVPINDVGALDFNLYLFPYDSSGNIQLYFVQCFNSGNVFQFSREGIPNIAAGGEGENIEFNYAPNGQFLIHTNLPADNTNKVNQIRQPITTVAQGGWTFERPIGSTAIDFVSFQRFGSAVTSPVATPRYAIDVICQSPAIGDTFKDLRLKYDDVNKFSSDTDFFTFGFSGISNGAGAINVQLVLIKNFGTGGSPTTETVLSTFNVQTSYQPFSVSFVFGSNTSKTIGLLDDDYIQLAFRFPVSSAFDCSITDVILASGQISSPIFPYTTDGQFVEQALSNGSQIAGYNGEDLYLPILNGANGFYFDRSQIGKIFSTIYPVPGVAELLCDGSQYETAALSPEGIPYSRLQSKLYNVAASIPIFGTGLNYVTSFVCASTTDIPQFLIVTNKHGVVTSPANGTPSPTFVYNRVRISTSVVTPAINYNAAYQFSATFSHGMLAQIKTQGQFFTSVPDAGTSGFLVTAYNMTPNAIDPAQNDNYSYFTLYINGVTSSSLAGKYFNFSNTTTQYYLWFKVDGVGTDPAIAGKTGIEVDILSTFTTACLAEIIAMAINDLDITEIYMASASSIPAGSYFTFESPSDLFYVWYTVDGAGTDPLVGGRKPIEVKLLGTDDMATVSLKTNNAINMKYFAVPDLRGIILKGWNNGSIEDIGATYRVSFNNLGFYGGDSIGTFEYDSNQNHIHTGTTSLVQNVSQALYAIIGNIPGGGVNHYVSWDPPGSPNLYTPYPSVDLSINSEGSSQSRPRNVYVNYVIKY